MKAIVLTTPQLATIAPLKAAAATACSAHQAAVLALNAALQTIVTAAGITTSHPRFSLTDDGTAIVVQ